MSRVRQGTLKDVLPPNNIAQEAALAFIDADDEAKEAKETADERKEDMVHAAQKLGVDTIKVRDARGDLRVFYLTNDVKIKHSKMTDVKIEKAELEALKA